MAASPALDAESSQLLAWLAAVERQGHVNHPAVAPMVQRARQRLKAIDDEKKRQKRQSKRAKKLWSTVVETVETHERQIIGPHSNAAEQLRKLAKSPSDGAALAEIGATLASVASKDPRLAAAAKLGIPLIQQLFVDGDDDDDDNDEVIHG